MSQRLSLECSHVVLCQLLPQLFPHVVASQYHPPRPSRSNDAYQSMLSSPLDTSVVPDELPNLWEKESEKVVGQEAEHLESTSVDPANPVSVPMDKSQAKSVYSELAEAEDGVKAVGPTASSKPKKARKKKFILASALKRKAPAFELSDRPEHLINVSSLAWSLGFLASGHAVCLYGRRSTAARTSQCSAKLY